MKPKIFGRTQLTNKKKTPCCENCGNLIPVGDGDHICDVYPTRVPVSGYMHTDDYFWCAGREFCPK